MTKREWLLLGVILTLGIVIAGCSAPVRAENSQANTVVKWLDDISDRNMLGYQSFSEIYVSEHNITCFVARAGSTGVAMQCFKDIENISSNEDMNCYNSGPNVVTCSYKPYGDQ